FSPNGEFLASASSPSDDEEVRVWDVARREFKYAVSVPSAKPLAFSSDGNYLLANDQLIDTKTRQVVRKFDTDCDFGTYFLRDDSFVIGAGYGALHLFDLSTEVELGAFAMPTEASIQSLAASENERWLACGGSDGEVYWFDVESLMDRIPRTVSTGPPPDGGQRHLAWSPDGRFIAAYANTNDDDGHITLWNTESWKMEHRIPLSVVIDLAFSADSGLLAACGHDPSKGDDEDGFVRFYDVKTGESTWTHRQPPIMAAIAFDPGNRLFAIYQYSETVKLRDVSTREVTGEFSFDAQQLVFSPDGRLLVARSHEGKVVAWDVKQGKVLWEVDAYNGYSIAMDVSPSGERIVTFGNDKDGEEYHQGVKLWDANSGAMTNVFQDVDSGVLGFSSDSTLLFEGSRYRVKARNLVTNKDRDVFTLVGSVADFAFSPDRQYLAYLAYD
ncbi:hypothetical protein LCGC14_2678150, partial [marine sediment metagenome]